MPEQGVLGAGPLDAGNRGKGGLPLYYRADLDGAAHSGRRDARG